MHPIAAGALAGFGATVPMTAVMLGWRELLPAHEQSPLPPADITRELTERADVEQSLDARDKRHATEFNHYGYGSAMGAAYGAMSSVLPPGIASGVLFGTGVWAVSYLGWLPLFHMRSAAANQPSGRNVMMIGSHIVWGAALGGLTALLLRAEKSASRDR